MRKYIIASHERMADGFKKTLDFITNGCYDIYAISAYVDDNPVEQQICEVFNTFSPDDEVVIMTDMLSGSVNQKFIPYRNNHTFLITGVNIPLALELLLYPKDKPITSEEIANIIRNAKDQIMFLNFNVEDLEGDE